jgi:alcohol dehydrogenase
MRALVFVGPGQLEWREVAAPSLQAPTDALVRPIAVARCDLDVALVRGKLPFAGPFAFGHELVAEVISVGEEVRAHAAGARVIVPCQISCGACARCAAGWTGYCERVPPRSAFGLGPICGDWGGALADVLRIPFADAMLVRLPDGVAPALLASGSDNLPDAWRTVGPQLRRRPGAAVLVVGGNGAPTIGLYAVGMARTLGASPVVYVDRDAERLAAARALGADVFDGFPPNKDRMGPFPIVVEASGHPKALAFALRSVAPGGACTSVCAYFGDSAPVPLWDMWLGGATLCTGLVNARADLPEVLALVARGFRPDAIPTRVVDWDDAAEAFLDPARKLVVTRATDG